MEANRQYRLITVGNLSLMYTMDSKYTLKKIRRGWRVSTEGRSYDIVWAGTWLISKWENHVSRPVGKLLGYLTLNKALEFVIKENK